MEKVAYQAVGRRKESVAQVKLVPGEGKIIVNDKPLNEYFSRKISEGVVREPLELTDTADKFDIFAKVRGGGLSGQAGALKHGISRALLQTDINLRPILRKAHLLTRDPRMKERRKYGQKGARARFQFSKR